MLLEFKRSVYRGFEDALQLKIYLIKLQLI